MKLEDQITNWELSKKLKELGVSQDSLFYWWGVFYSRPCPQPDEYGEHEKERAYQDQEWSVSLKKDIFDDDTRSWKGMYKNTLDTFSAFTVAELGEMLIDGCGTGRSVLTNDKKYQGMFRGEKFEDDNEANCRAKMLIWLVENGYLQLESEGQDDNK